MNRDSEVRLSSDRSFGITMACVIGFIALVNWRIAGTWWAWLIGVSAVFMVPALVAPSILRPANWLWFKFGMLLHMIVTPVVMAAVFFTAVSATGIAMRLLGKNLLQLKPPKRRADSYWIPRHPPGPAPESLKDQF